MAKFETDDEHFEHARLMILAGKDRTFRQVVDRIGKTRLCKALGFHNSQLNDYFVRPGQMLMKYIPRMAALLKVDDMILLKMWLDLWKSSGRNL